jgi:hypothetical protein
MGSNVEGNRRAALMLANEKAMYRRVRLTVRLGVVNVFYGIVYDSFTSTDATFFSASSFTSISIA